MRKTSLIVIILILLGNTSCYAARVDGPYKGRVIDAGTVGSSRIG